jgi:MOSC domain-containing protein YiiM
VKVSAICIGRPEKVPGRTYKTGLNKGPVSGAVLIDESGLLGDSVLNRKHHGGPDQAVYGMGSVDLASWSAELGETVAPGTFGENLVIDGLDSRIVRVGDRFQTEDILLEVTSTRTPCATLSARMGDPRFARRFYQMARPGFYARVLRNGTMRAGDPVTHIPFDGQSVTMPYLLGLVTKQVSDEERAHLLALPISERLRAALSG